MFLEVHISCKHIYYNTTTEVHSLCQVLNPLFGYTKGSVVEAAIQVSKEELYFFHVHSLLDSGDWKKHLDFCLDRQRAEDADKTCRFLPFHDLFCDRNIQVTSINFSRKEQKTDRSSSAFVQVSLLLAQHQWPFLRSANLVQVIQNLLGTMTLLVLLHFSTGTPSGSLSTPWDLSVRVLLL